MENLTRKNLDAFATADKCYARSRALALKYLAIDMEKYEKATRLEYYFLGKCVGIADIQENIRKEMRQTNKK